MVFRRSSWPFRRRLPYNRLFVVVWQRSVPMSPSLLFWLFWNAEEMDSAVSPASGFPLASLVWATGLYFSCDRSPCCSSFNPPRYASFNFTWDAEVASNELGFKIHLATGFSRRSRHLRTFRCNRTWCGRGTCRNKIRRHIRYRSRFGHNPFIFLFLNSCHRSAANQAEIFGAAKRAEMANIEQRKKIIPLITREISFGQDVCELEFGVNVPYLNLGVQIYLVKQPIHRNSEFLTHVLSWDFGLRLSFLISASLSSKTCKMALAPESTVLDGMWSMLEWRWCAWIGWDCACLAQQLPTGFVRSICSVRYGMTYFRFCRAVWNWSLFPAHPTCWHKRVSFGNTQDTFLMLILSLQGLLQNRSLETIQAVLPTQQNCRYSFCVTQYLSTHFFAWLSMS